MKGGKKVAAHNEEKSIINEEAEKTKSKTLVRNAKTRWEPSNLLAGQGRYRFPLHAVAAISTDLTWSKN